MESSCDRKKSVIRMERRQEFQRIAWRFLKFVFAGTISLAFVYFTTNLGVAVGLETHFAYLVGIAVTLLVNFIVCRYLVFRTSRDNVFFREFVRFVWSIGLWRICEVLAFIVLYDFLQLRYQHAIIMVAAIMIGFKFAWCQVFVFKKIKTIANS
jgi:putative flippase GtrA